MSLDKRNPKVEVDNGACGVFCPCCGGALRVFEQPNWNHTAVIKQADCQNPACPLHMVTMHPDELAALTVERIEQYRAMQATRAHREDCERAAWVFERVALFGEV